MFTGQYNLSFNSNNKFTYSFYLLLQIILFQLLKLLVIKNGFFFKKKCFSSFFVCLELVNIFSILSYALLKHKNCPPTFGFAACNCLSYAYTSHYLIIYLFIFKFYFFSFFNPNYNLYTFCMSYIYFFFLFMMCCRNTQRSGSGFTL